MMCRSFGCEAALAQQNLGKLEEEPASIPGLSLSNIRCLKGNLGKCQRAFSDIGKHETLFLTAGRFSQALEKAGMREEKLSFRDGQRESHSSSMLAKAMMVPGS